MSGASSYGTQFLSHSGPRGPQGMNPGGMVPSRPGLPPSSGGLYASHPAQTQRMPQHGGYPGGQQGLKRPFHSEVGNDRSNNTFLNKNSRYSFCTGVVIFCSVKVGSSVEERSIQIVSMIWQSTLFFRVFQASSMVLEGCLGSLTSLCSTLLAHSRDVHRHPLTLPAGCPTWDSTLLDLTIQHSSLLVPASQMLHSIIRYPDPPAHTTKATMNCYLH